MRNTALNQLRVAGYDLDELVDTLAAAEDPEEEVERRALVRQTLAAVAALPERQRDALLRTAIEGRGQDEVARELGLTEHRPAPARAPRPRVGPRRGHGVGTAADGRPGWRPRRRAPSR